ncbi:MAG: ferredoxin--NADP reductase [Ignavibacteria bacterium]|jgi:ring-1,2-phenylacetyl-CoA epoxidase subunit PaaE|nr:ferredoxin--NADP reductase [Ignavibacteria bacterium]MCU7504798.1 ferredoxin--NADP reductase [Ignavibacteria bacterium]MCU7517684.1 ferredoxin--NADP reductase [Ignavibacteria bacterium]
MESYLSLKVTGVIEETEDARTFLFKEESGREIPFLPGQFLTICFIFNGEEVRRSYSISTSVTEKPYLGITIKKTLEGHATNYFADNIKTGDTLKAFPPLGRFVVDLSPEKKHELVLVGAGSGISPLMSILKSTLIIEPESSVRLFYGNRNEESIIFRKELEELENYYAGRLKVVHTLSQPDKEWQGFKGRITRELFIQLLREYNPSKEAQFYVCGPNGMIINVLSALAAEDVDPARVHTEYFTVSINENEDVPDEEIKPRNVTIIFQGKEQVIIVKPGDSILDAALEQGLELPNSCRIGQCSSCRAKMISGKINLVEQTALTEEEIRQSYCLTCVGFPLSDDIVIDYDATAPF